MIAVEKVMEQDLAVFREMVLAYWQELMPKSDVVRDIARQNAYFQEQFAWGGVNKHPHWLKLTGQAIGFVSFAVFEGRKRAEICDFYIIPEKRRQGYGTEAVRCLFQCFDERGVEQLDLNVRRDNPNALAFWQAQGFGIAGYQLRQYRDPTMGTVFVGVLSSDFE
jgi:ribosomal protein S18 acetylase RimI-like enzyme